MRAVRWYVIGVWFGISALALAYPEFNGLDLLAVLMGIAIVMILQLEGTRNE